MFVKSFIFLLNDIGNYFSNIPVLFPAALEYVLSHGLLNVGFSKFFIDSNAVECLRNFSFECLNLFTNEMIYKTLEITERSLGFLHEKYADKLIEAIISIISKLPESEVVVARKKILAFILTEISASCPGNLEINSKGLYKGILLMSAAFGAMNGSNSQEVWGNLADIILKTVEICLKGLSAVQFPEILNAGFLLLKRAVLLCSTLADCFFYTICDFVLAQYVPGREKALEVITSCISVLYSEPVTLNWFMHNYLQLYLKLRDSLAQDPNPEIIENFYDLQTRLFEARLPPFTNTLPETLQITINLCPFLTDRVAAKSVLAFCNLIFSRFDSENSRFVPALTCAFLASLNKLSINVVHLLSSLFNHFKVLYLSLFEEGIALGFNAVAFSGFSAQDKERLRFCILKTDTVTVNQMKLFINNLSNILKGRGTMDSIIATEIAISSKSVKVQVID